MAGKKLTDQDIEAISKEAGKARSRVLLNEGGISGRCFICVTDLALKLKKMGYPAKVAEGTFTVDNPDPKVVPEEDFESGEAFTPAHYWVEIGDLLVDPTVDQFADEVDGGLPEIAIGPREEMDRHTTTSLAEPRKS